MTRSSWFTLAYALMLGAAGPLTACASNGNDAAETTSARRAPIEESRLGQTPQTAPPAQTSQGTSPYTDAQVQSFVAARAEIQALPAGTGAAYQQQVSGILQSHNLAPDVYNAIDAAARTDQALANRVSAAAAGSTSFTDEQLRSFVAASTEIDPLNRQLATATGEARAPIVEQIRAALARNNLTVDAYNGIAARAQTDQTLAARIQQIRTAQTPAPTPNEG